MSNVIITTNSAVWLKSSARYNKDYHTKVKDYLEQYPSIDNMEKKLFNKLRTYFDRAYNREKYFLLTPEEFINLLSSSCNYCGNNAGMTIDRTDSSLGYTVDNSKSCCNICNSMKFVSVEFDFLQHIKRIYEYQEQTKKV